MSAKPLTDLLTTEQTRLNAKKSNIDATMKAQGRLMSLNDSYRKKYSKYTQMVAIFTISVILFLLLNALPTIAPFIPRIIIDVLIVLLVFIATYKLFTIYTEIQSRSNLNYDELDIPPKVDPSANFTALALGQSDNKDKSMDLNALYGILAQYGITTCVGQQCCPEGWTYDETANSCIENVGRAKSGFTLLSDVPEEEKREVGFPKTNLGSPASGGSTFRTVGEQFVEPRFLAQPLNS